MSRPKRRKGVSATVSYREARDLARKMADYQLEVQAGSFALDLDSPMRKAPAAPAAASKKRSRRDKSRETGKREKRLKEIAAAIAKKLDAKVGRAWCMAMR